jgi:hypothetical protein
LLAPRPQVAAGKAAKHGGTPGMGTFALQGVENFLDAISHSYIQWSATLHYSAFRETKWLCAWSTFAPWRSGTIKFQTQLTIRAAAK